jgi:single-stranded DNA-binding protein
MRINQVTMAGNIVREPRHGIKNDSAWLAFSIAVNKRYRTTEGEWINAPAKYWDVLANGSLAANALPMIKKGVRVVVVGSMEYNENEKDGRSYKNVFILADDIALSGLYVSNSNNGVGNMSDDDLADLATGSDAPAVPAKASRYEDDGDDA